MKSLALPRIDIIKTVSHPFILAPILLLIGCILGMSIAYHRPSLWLLAFAVLLAIAIFKYPQAGIWVIFVSVFLFDWLNRSFFIIPRQITWLKDIAIFLLFLRTVPVIIRRHRLIRTPIDLAVLFLICIGIISTFINHTSPMVAFMGFRKAIKYILLFYIIVNIGFDNNFLKRIIKAFIIIGFIQIPFAVSEYIIWQPSFMNLGGGMGQFDFITGTFPRGGSGKLSIYLIGIMCFLIGYYLYANRNKMKVIFYSLLLFIPLPLAMSRASFVFLPLVVGFLVLRKIKKKFITKISYFVLFSLMFWGMLKVTYSVTGINLINYLTNPGLAFEKQNVPTSLHRPGRIGGIRVVQKTLETKSYGLLFGVGPGQWSESYFSGYSGDLWKEFSGSSASRINQIAATLSEWGILGLIALFLITFQIYRMNSSFFETSNDNFWRIISYGFSGIIFLYVMATLYICVFNIDTGAFFFWTLAGAIFTVGRRKSIFEKRRI